LDKPFHAIFEFLDNDPQKSTIILFGTTIKDCNRESILAGISGKVKKTKKEHILAYLGVMIDFIVI
jgi:hypothetical protein